MLSEVEEKLNKVLSGLEELNKVLFEVVEEKVDKELLFLSLQPHSVTTFFCDPPSSFLKIKFFLSSSLNIYFKLVPV